MNDLSKIPVLKNNKSYRVGDVIYRKGIRWKEDREILVSEPVYDKTILSKYLKGLTDLYQKRIDWKEIISIMNNRSCPDHDDSVIYLNVRAGDMVTDNTWHKECNIFNIQRVVDKLSKYNMHNVCIVTALHYGSNEHNNKYFYNESNHDVNISLLSNMILEFKKQLNCNVSIHTTELTGANCIDHHMMLLCSAKNVMLDSGGFSRFIRDARVAKRRL